MILREGENLCLQGDLTHSFYIVKSGALTATSKDEQNGTQILNFGPGSTFGELSLIAGEPMEYTVHAEEDCEIEVVPQSTLHDTMKEQPIWLKSILAFLTQRNHIAQENKRKSDLITTFPSLLFVLSRVPAKDISLVALQDEMAQFSKPFAIRIRICREQATDQDSLRNAPPSRHIQEHIAEHPFAYRPGYPHRICESRLRQRRAPVQRSRCCKLERFD